MEKNILITGGAGFIGSHLSHKLVSLGHNVTVIDNLSKQIHGENPERSHLYQSIKNKVRFLKGNVTSKKAMINAIKDQNIIVHLAAETGTGQSMYQIHNYSEVNIGGTSLLLDILANTNHKIEKLIVASSRAVYGEGKYFCENLGNVYPDHRTEEFMDKGDFEVKYPGCKKKLKVLATDEASKLHPSSVYGITKQFQEQLVLTVCKTLGIEAVAFRYQNVYGPGQSLSNPYTGILSIFSSQIRNHIPLNIFEDGNESRDFVYVDDVVDATILGINKKEANGNVFNVGYGKPISVLTVANALIEGFGIDNSLEITGRYRLGDIRHNFADLTKIKEKLAFQPKIDFFEGISKFIAWVEGQDVSIIDYENSIKEMQKRNLYK